MRVQVIVWKMILNLFQDLQLELVLLRCLVFAFLKLHHGLLGWARLVGFLIFDIIFKYTRSQFFLKIRSKSLLLHILFYDLHMYSARLANPLHVQLPRLENSRLISYGFHKPPHLLILCLNSLVETLLCQGHCRLVRVSGLDG